MSKLFISYRRDDSADVTGRIYDRLAVRYGANNIFRDVDAIPLGIDFRTQLHAAVSRCAVLLAVIGRQWLTLTDAAGRRRLDDAGDFVRIEIEAALQRGIPVIPVLTQGTAMPTEAQLPQSLQALAFRNGLAVRPDPDFHSDVNNLIQDLDRLRKQNLSLETIGMNFVRVPRGMFWMGGGGGKPGNKQVEIPHDFYIGVYPVTQAQWQAVMGDNPSWFSRGGNGKDAVKDISDVDLNQFPVEQVSWDDAQEFLKELNAREKDNCWVYRLPIATEWEYACRAGATSPEDCSFDFYFDLPTEGLSPQRANFGKTVKRTTKVGSYKPNRLGLYDMHGNVWEWCDDSYQGGSRRMIRGGGWLSRANICRAAYHSEHAPSNRINDLGFRVARVPSGK